MRIMNVNYCAEDATVITASSADSSFPVSNLKHQFRSKRWRSTGVSSEWVLFDMVTTEEIDSVVILWPKETGILLSDTAVVKIQANATNVWTSPAVDVTLSIDDTYMQASHFFSSDQTYRYWRVVIQDAGNPNGYLELGVVWLGKSLNVENAQNGFSFELVDRSKVSSTDYGHTYVDEYPLTAQIQFSYQYLDYDAIQVLENAFRTNGTRDPVMVVLDESGDVFDKDHFCVYGKFGNSFGLKHVRYNLFNVEGISILELS